LAQQDQDITLSCTVTQLRANEYHLGNSLKYFVFAGYAVAQLVEALYYKPEGRGFVYRWGHLDFLLTQFF
jgi:hypothetical protein